MASPSQQIAASYSESRKYLQNAQNGNLDAVISALEKRADPFFQNQSSLFEPIAGIYAAAINNDNLPRGTTALHLAARNGHNKVVDYLIKNYSKLISTFNRDGETALFWAKRDCVDLLLTHKIDVFVKTKDPIYPNIFEYPDKGYNALFTQIFVPNPAGVEAILKHIYSSCPQRRKTEDVLNHQLPPPLINIITSYIVSLPTEDILLPDRIMKIRTLRQESDEIRKIFESIETITGWNPGEWTQTVCKRADLAPVLWHK